MRHAVRFVPLLSLVLLPATVDAQGSITPLTPAHPALPWGLGIATPYGQLIRYVPVPPQQIVIDTVVPMPAEPTSEAVSAQARTGDTPVDQERQPPPPVQYGTLRQTVIVPGYLVRETTVGYHYPERWVIEQVAPGLYRWRLAAAAFRSR